MRQHALVLPGTQRHDALVLPGTQRREVEQDLGEAWEQGLQWPLDQDGGADGVSQKVLPTWTHQTRPGSSRPWICSGEMGDGVQLLKGMVTKRRMRNPVALPSPSSTPSLFPALSFQGQGSVLDTSNY